MKRGEKTHLPYPKYPNQVSDPNWRYEVNEFHDGTNKIFILTAISSRSSLLWIAKLCKINVPSYFGGLYAIYTLQMTRSCAPACSEALTYLTYATAIFLQISFFFPWENLGSWGWYILWETQPIQNGAGLSESNLMSKVSFNVCLQTNVHK